MADQMPGTDRVHLGLAVLVAIPVVWSYRLRDLLDLDHDVMFARQVLNGLNPYKVGLAPRPPSAWLLQMPLVWVDTAFLSRAAGAAAIVAVSWLAVRLAGVSTIWLPVVTATVTVTSPAQSVVGVGNMASVVAVLVAIAWHRRSGVAIGLAAALRLYPMIFALPIRRWSAVWTVGILTGVGLIIVPDLGLSDMVENSQTIIRHTANGSVHRMVGLLPGIGLGAVIAWRSMRVSFDHGMSLAACAAVLVPSVSWPSYSLVLIPAGGWAVAQGRWWVLAAVPFWVTDGSHLLARDFGSASFAAALIVLAAVWHRESPPTRRSRGHTASHRGSA